MRRRHLGGGAFSSPPRSSAGAFSFLFPLGYAGFVFPLIFSHKRHNMQHVPKPTMPVTIRIDLLAVLTVCVLVAGCSKPAEKRTAQTNVVAETKSPTVPPAAPVKPGDSLEGVSSQSISAFDDAGTRLAVLTIYAAPGDIDADFVQAVVPYSVFDADKKPDAIEAISKLKDKYKSPAAAGTLKLLEDMWNCPEEVISFKIRAAQEELVFSKGTPISSADWEILDLSRRAGNVAGQLVGEDHPEKAVELLNGNHIDDASPRFIAWIESITERYKRRAEKQANQANP